MSRVMVLIGMLFVAGCQTGMWPADKAALDQEAFERFWGLYQDCRTADLATILARTPQWERMAAPPSGQPVRLSVDPQALAAACAVNAGNLALAQGERELAVELFSLVLDRYTDTTYAFYAGQARDGLLRTVPGATTASASPASFTR